MYDTIIFLIHKKDIGDSHKWQAVLLNIFQTCEYKQVAGGCGYTGGLRISVTENRVRIEGSLSKYYYGNNTQTLTLAHAKEAIKRLGRQLNLPIDKADVMEVDIAENFEMKYSPDLYISKLQTLGSSHPNKWHGTTYFPINGSMLRFYDKGQESRQRGNRRLKRERCPLPERENKNLLRYEMKFKKAKIRQVFGRQLKAKDLYNRQVFWQFISEWSGTYEDIGKMSDKLFDVTFEQIKSAKDLENWCMCVANSVINLPNYIKEQLFKHRKNPQDTDYQYHKRLQDRLQKAFSQFTEYMGQSDLMTELTEKIEKYLSWKFTESPDAYDKD